MKKICYVTTLSMTLKAFIIDVAQYLHDKGGYDITFICDYDELFEKELPDYIKYMPVSMKRGIAFSGWISIFKMYLIFRSNNFDLIQYSTPNASLYASVAAKLARVPVRLYCQWGIYYVGLKGIKRRVFKLVEKIVCSLSTVIEPDSFGNLYFARQEGLYSDIKSSVVWNGSASGVNLEKFNISFKQEWRSEVREQLGLEKNSFVVGFVGRLTQDKGINELFTACKKLFEEKSNIALLLIGESEHASSINEGLYQWSLNERRVFYCGRTTRVEKYMAAMDVFVLPSYREGFGTVVIEAEAMGVPVIVTDIPGPTDAMIDNETGLTVQKGNVGSLESSLRYIFDNSDLAKTMGENGRTHVERRFDRDLLFDKILADRQQLFERSERVI